MIRQMFPHTFAMWKYFKPLDMKRSLRYLCALLVVMSVASMLSQPAEAQFLKKLAKGISKVNQTLDNVEKALKGEKVSRSDSSQQSSNDATQSNDTTAAVAEPDNSRDESKWETFKPQLRTPYLTSRTLFMKSSLWDQDISDVHDGVFAVKRNGKFEFWRVDGEKLFGADWEYCGNGYSGTPMFSGGVAVARRSTPNAAGKKPACLLYLDGRVKELDPAWTEISSFCDGLALVEATVNYKKQYFYINASGKKVYPNLSVYGDDNHAMRPLRNGLRAYCADYKKWGFIDAQGNVVIPAKYAGVRNFSEGYAWVALPGGEAWQAGELILIDTKGEEVWRPGIQINTGLIVNNGTFSDVSNGIVYVEEGSVTVYYDVHGRKLKSFEGGNRFYDGYAFVRGKALEDRTKSNGVYLVNTSFAPVKVVDDNALPGWVIEEYGPNFEPYGLATIKAESKVVTPRGDVILKGFDDMSGNYIRGFRQFSESGYAKATEVYLLDNRYVALIKPSGEIAWLFAENDYAAGPFNDEEIGRLPIIDDPIIIRDTIRDIIRDTVPDIRIIKQITVIDRNREPIGPKQVEPATFRVAVRAQPGEGGTVNLTPSGVFGYGDFATVTASPNKDWAISYIETDYEGGKGIAAGEPFSVIADQTITVHFVKKDDDEKPSQSGAYQGSLNFDMNKQQYHIPVYAQIDSDGSDSNPYGDNTYGYLAVMFDPDVRYTDDKNTFCVSLFAAPLQICGVQHDEAAGKDWLVLDGGSFTAGNMKFNPACGNPFAGLIFQMMLSFDGFSTINAQPRHYRVEMLDIDAETGEFTLGNLQTFSSRAGGWVPGGDKSLTNVKKGFFGTASESGYPSDFFHGVRMKSAPRRGDIQWYPTQSWCENKSAFDQLVESMGAAYRNTKSEYRQMFDEK